MHVGKAQFFPRPSSAPLLLTLPTRASQVKAPSVDASALEIQFLFSAVDLSLADFIDVLRFVCIFGGFLPFY